jgi:aerobic-type carbon monoxide dehydrogenase small subunit (CoxS/CutS family)
MASVTLRVNGIEHRLDLPPDLPLLYALREHLQMTGTKYGCGEGQCGACTVLLEGRPVRSCRTPVAQAMGKRITTIEGLEQSGKLAAVQKAFLEQEAFQCGYCTSGMIMSAVGLLNSNPRPSDEDIVRFMNGNMCRCGVYGRVMAAVRQAAEEGKAERS